jgi:hypothetical protein
MFNPIFLRSSKSVLSFRFSLQRDNDPSLAPSTLEFDSLSHQTRQQTAATATQGTVFLS